MSAQTEWPFKDPKNVAVVTTVGVMDRPEPVCLVSHDDDGWQFTTGRAVTYADPMVVALNTVVATDTTLLELADLPPGWMATRENAQSPWQRSPRTGEQ
jgi:hypothetical protein